MFKEVTEILLSLTVSGVQNLLDVELNQTPKEKLKVTRL